jgi:putative cell wall-binding protein
VRQSHRARLVLAAAGVVAAASIVAIAPWSNASHGGSDGRLTSSNGTNAIRFTVGELTTSETVFGAQWSPDGCRAVFTTPDREILTVRHDDGNRIGRVADAPSAGVTRAHPTWVDRTSLVGAQVVWAQQNAPDQQWHLRIVPAAPQRVDGSPITPTDDGFDYTHPDGGPGVVVYQRQARSGGRIPEIWRAVPGRVIDRSLVVSDGRYPAVSPDGTKAAFVRSDGANDQIFVIGIGGGTAIQVTDTPGTKFNPTWSPDARTIAFQHLSFVNTVPANAVKATTVTTAPNLNGAPAFQSNRRNQVHRLSGPDRFATAARISQSNWGSSTAGAVVLSRSDQFADAVGGAALAKVKNGPLLLTPPTGLHPVTRAEIIRVLGTSAPATKTVYLLGGPGSISPTVHNQIAALGYTTRRLQGADRYATAVAIANEIDPTPGAVLAADGRDFPDALAAGAASGAPRFTPAEAAVVILTNGPILPTVVRDYLDGLSAQVAVVGIGGAGAAAVAPYAGMSTPIVGTNRYHTAALVAERFHGTHTVVGVATGTGWPDALAGGALMAVRGVPLLLTNGTAATLVSDTASALDMTCGSVDLAYIFGGPGTITVAQEGQIGRWISGPGGFATTQDLRPRHDR